MDVKDKISINESYSIEWGKATWNSNNFSIRNRYDTKVGKFNYAGSSEVPWNDFKKMIIESIRRKHFSNVDIAEILKEIGDSIKDE